MQMAKQCNRAQPVKIILVIYGEKKEHYFYFLSVIYYKLPILFIIFCYLLLYKGVDEAGRGVGGTILMSSMVYFREELCPAVGHNGF